MRWLAGQVVWQEVHRPALYANGTAARSTNSPPPEEPPSPDSVPGVLLPRVVIDPARVGAGLGFLVPGLPRVFLPSRVEAGPDSVPGLAHVFYPDRVATGPYFVPGSPRDIAVALTPSQARQKGEADRAHAGRRG